jgi:hypothetical protein
MSTGATVGAGLGGLAALAGLILLVVLLKKKKEPSHPADSGTASPDLTTEDNCTFISEYGLSEDEHRGGGVEDLPSDIVCPAASDHGYQSDVEHLSEHNPEDLDNPLPGTDGSE